jgi:flavin reductase (DIM6/NTAB) family NADH-FMN oxidoreductase RutF
VNSAAISAIFNQLDHELWLVTAQAGGLRSGLIATCISVASIVPEMPRVLIGLSHQQFTRELVEAGGAFALHLFSEQQLDWVWRFALSSGRDVDKFAGLSWKAGAGGSPILADALGWLDCRLETRLDAGDRTFYLAEVLDGSLGLARGPLTVKRLLELTPPDKLQQIKERHERDIAAHALLIEAWRKLRGKDSE